MSFNADMMPMPIIDRNTVDQDESFTSTKVETEMDFARNELKDGIVNFSTCLQDDSRRP